MSRIFEPSELNGKQLLHITSPADIPVNTIREMSLRAFQKGEPVLQHKGVEYGFHSDTSAGSTTGILVPTKEGFQLAPTRISSTMRLQQIMRPPDISQRRDEASNTSKEAFKYKLLPMNAPRAQPKGLKMRYRPSGLGATEPDTLGSSDSEEAAPVTQPSHFRTLPGTELNGRLEKRKHGEDAGEDKEARRAAKRARKEEKRRHKETKNAGAANSEASVSQESVKTNSVAVSSQPSTNGISTSSPMKALNQGSWDWPPTEIAAKDKEKKKKKKKKIKREESEARS